MIAGPLPGESLESGPLGLDALGVVGVLRLTISSMKRR